MYLHSLSFVLLFCPLVVTGWWILSSKGQLTARKVLLLAASALFYALGGWSSVPVLAGSILLNYLLARRAGSDAPREARLRWLWAGIAANVVLLGVFKYTGFVVENAAALTGARWQAPRLLLPLGVSFFTISQIMHLVDCYESLVKPAKLLDHALYASMFPYVTMGPIVRARDLIPQLDRERPSEDRLAEGVVLFVFGLCKKIVLADTLGRLVDLRFPSLSALGLVDAWALAAAYTLQIYFDLSGYSDMAIGVGKMLGLKLPVNFDAPLRAVSVVDFWKRWHVSLSTFITTYLYTPMARLFRPLTFRAAMGVTLLSMTIAGLWHGAAWKYVVFGVLHGLGLVTNQVWKKTKRKLPRGLAWALTSVFVMVAFVIFRAEDLADARRVYASMLGAHGLVEIRTFSPLAWLRAAPAMLIGAGAALMGRTSQEIVADFKPSRRWVVGVAAAFVVCLHFMNASESKGFIYGAF